MLEQYFSVTIVHVISQLHVHVLMRDEKEGRKKQARSNNNKAKQHSTPKAVTCPKKNELLQVGLEPTTLHTIDRTLYQLSYQSSMYIHVMLLKHR